MHHCYFVILLILMSSCSPRVAEPPTGSSSSFLPPTSPTVVISNFRNAFIDRNAENFVMCLADTSGRTSIPYRFEPSAEIAARFSTLFVRWTIQSERQALLSLFSRIPAGVSPSLDFLNSSVAFSSPDSFVYVTDYQIMASHGLTSLPEAIAGTMVLTVVPEATGLWSISRWSDARRSGDSLENTWSLLKAQLSN